MELSRVSGAIISKVHCLLFDLPLEAKLDQFQDHFGFPCCLKNDYKLILKSFHNIMEF